MRHARPGYASSLAVAAVMLLGGTSTLRAQAPTTARIEGTVFDSVGMRALGAARVQLVDARDPSRVRTVDADASGRYAFDAVPTGEYLLGFLHPRADSLLLRPPTLRVTVRQAGSVRAPIALPSVATLVARACRVDFRRDSTGLLLGAVRDARDGSPRVGVRVVATWRDLELRKGGLFEKQETGGATSLEDGSFAICGIPAGVTAVLAAGAGEDSSGTFEVAVPAAGFAVRDVVVGRGALARVTVRDSLAPPESQVREIEVRRGAGSLRTRVVRADGAPVAGAVARARHANVEARADADGQIAFDSLPTGTQTLDVRAIGYFPRRVTVDVADEGGAHAPIVLEALGVMIDTVRIVGAPWDNNPRGLRNFADRRRRGSGGHFMNEEEIEKRYPLYLTDLLRQMPGVLVTPKLRGYGYDIWMMGGEAIGLTRRCVPDLWLDGMPAPKDFEFNHLVSGYDIYALEVYTRAVQVPVEFQSMSGCGAIVVWTGVRKSVKR